LALALDQPASLHRGDGGEAYDLVEATDAGCVGIVALLERGRRETAFDLLNDPAGLQAIGVLLEDLEDRLQDLSGPLACDLRQSSSPPGPTPYKGGTILAQPVDCRAATTARESLGDLLANLLANHA
jgi:hypothetical protein